MENFLIKNDIFWNSMEGDVSHRMGLYVIFRDIEERKWMDLMDQGFCPAMNIYHAKNRSFKAIEGYNLYYLGIKPYIF